MTRSGKRIAAMVTLSCVFPTLIVGIGWQAHAERLPTPPRPGTFTLEIKSEGYERTAVVHIPHGFTPDKSLPVVLVLHGAGGSGEQMLQHNGWAAKSEQAGFIVVAPDGLAVLPRLAANFRLNPRVWNSGQLNPRSPRAQIDDVKYVDELFAALQPRLSFDEKRVYVAGHSNGGGMAFRLGAELSERFAALAPVAGSMSVNEPQPKRALPTLYIVGAEDPIQPVAGGEVKLPWGNRTNLPVANYLTAWAGAINCENEPVLDAEDELIKRVTYHSQNQGPSLTAIYVKGHGHTWPGTIKTMPDSMWGPITRNLNATDVIWEFFTKHQRN